MNIQLRIKQNEFVSGHFFWNACNYYLAQNIGVGFSPKMVFSFETFSFIIPVKISYCLFQVQQKFFHNFNTVSNNWNLAEKRNHCK